MRVKLVILAVAALLAAGGCGDDDGGGSPFGAGQGNGTSGDGSTPPVPDVSGEVPTDPELPSTGEDIGGEVPTDPGTSTGDYTVDMGANFVEWCTSVGGEEADCQCVWGNILTTVPVEEYQAFEAAFEQDQFTELPDFLAEAASGCENLSS